MIGINKMTTTLRRPRIRSTPKIRDLAVACITLAMGASQVDAAPQRMGGKRLGGQQIGGSSSSPSVAPTSTQDHWCDKSNEKLASPIM